jgi:hypothetical protein
MDDDLSFDLLHVYDPAEPGVGAHLVCFIEPDRVQATGEIPGPAIVGEFQPLPDGEFDPTSFKRNDVFVEALVQYQNDVAILGEDLVEQAQANPGAQLFLFDHRNSAHHEPDDDTPLTDIIGSFQVQPDGHPAPGSFNYNPHHLLFDPHKGPSFLLSSKRFYRWLHGIQP